MADLKISALPAATTPLAGTEVLPIVQSSTTKQVSVANLSAGTYISSKNITTRSSGGSGATGNNSTIFGTTDATSAGETITIQTNLNSGGTTQYGMIINGSAGSYTVYAARFYDVSTSAVVGSIQFTSIATSYNTLSDRRLKSNISSITPEQSGLIIDALRPRSFTWNDGSNDVGFIADEVQEIIPNAVTGEANAVDEEGKPVYQMVDMSQPELIAYLVTEVQSLRARIKLLE